MKKSRLLGALCVALFLLVARPANAATIFSVSPVVTTADRSATFDSLTSNGTDLSSYSEDSLFITVNDSTFQGFLAFSPNDLRTTAFHYGSGGNNEYVSIRGTDNAVFTAIDFLLGNGRVGNDLTNIRWETYLNGFLTGSGTESDVEKGLVVGWSDVDGFDELRVASGISQEPGFGNFQSVAIDDLRVQLVPLPATVWLFGSGLLGLVGMARCKRAA